MEFNTQHSYTLTATCASRMGTTAAVTGFLAATGCTSWKCSSSTTC